MIKDYHGPERRNYVQLPDEEFERMAQRAAKIVEDNFALKVGNQVLGQIRWVLIAVITVASAWAVKHGFIDP